MIEKEVERNKICDNCDNIITGREYRIGELHLCYRCYTALRHNAFKNKDATWTDKDEKTYKTLQTPKEKREYSTLEIRKEINKAKQSLFKKFLENCKHMKGRANGETVAQLAKIYFGTDSKKNLTKIRTWMNKARKKNIPIFAYEHKYYIPTKKIEAKAIYSRFLNYKRWNADSYTRTKDLLKRVVPSFTITTIRKILKKEKVEE